MKTWKTLRNQAYGILVSVVTKASDLLQKSRVTFERPVFIWGNGQSGTYLLYDVLALSGAFSFYGTTGERKKGFATQKYGGHSIYMSKKPVEGLVHFWADVGLPWQREKEFVYTRVLTRDDQEHIDVGRVRERYGRIKTVWRWQQQETTRILDKATNYMLMVDLLDVVFPQALHLFCIRDPRMVLHSIVRRFKDPEYEASWAGYPSGFYSNILLPGWETVADTSIEERHAWQIQHCISIGLQHALRLGQRCLIVRYESLCNETEVETKRIAAFAGINYQGGLLTAIGNGIHPVREYRWPSSSSDRDDAKSLWIDPSVVAHLEAFTDFAVRLGYSKECAGRLCAPSAPSNMSFINESTPFGHQADGTTDSARRVKGST